MSEVIPFRGFSLHDQVAERIRAQIFDRHLASGEFIDEIALAEKWQISRTPLREALKVLAAEGLVTMKLRRGAYVTEVSERDLAEVFHLLALLESDAARVAATQATAEGMAELMRIHDELESSLADRDRFFAANERFHMRLLEIADNRWRVQMVADLRKVMKLNRHHSLFKQGRLADSLSEHRAIMAAIDNRDAAAATRLMRAHFDNGLEAAA